jgi:hypothetical protein
MILFCSIDKSYPMEKFRFKSILHIPVVEPVGMRNLWIYYKKRTCKQDQRSNLSEDQASISL